jgi:hypothetical protein
MTKKMLMAVACLGAAIGSAQTMETTVHVNLPYDTQVGKVSLPAGEYSIHEVSNSVIEIRSDARKGVNVFSIVTPVIAANHATADHTKVVLGQDDNGAYELKSIWLEGQDVGFEVSE